MKYKNIVEGKLINRENRFIATVDINGNLVRVHVPNTGRCKEIFIPGARVILEKSNNPKRKTPYSLVSTYKGDLLINIDSQAPNKIVKEALTGKKLFSDISYLKPEYSYGDSRFDFYFERSDKKCFMEVKGVTLEKDSIAMFPDAPTLRGKKHIEGLIEASSKGYVAYILFLIQMETISSFIPNLKMDPSFSNALKFAKESGVNILCYDSLVSKDEVVFNKSVPLLNW
ncbi:DNA/RNA nuclease SfsA [Peptoniphilus catoniae]|uniref:DNA/RNA nuclease SfsA n=1 Tax=Peptoniphilus catoniae TaxID=1660341 RepID=UPI0010FE39A0|nr:DNA/RNA nuclease SfsA [Peptoniphilus catoniae]